MSYRALIVTILGLVGCTGRDKTRIEGFDPPPQNWNQNAAVGPAPENQLPNPALSKPIEGYK